MSAVEWCEGGVMLDARTADIETSESTCVTTGWS
jgi:hypothetical protein